MKKKVLAVILLTVGASLAACGQKETPPPATEVATTAAQEITTAAATEAAPKTEVKTGQGEGYGGPITAEVTLDGDKIVDLKLTGDQETPGIGADALEPLKKAILEKGGLDGVDAVAGATWTSNGVFEAVGAAPNYDGEHLPHLTGFPGQSYNADENHDEKVDIKK